MNNTSFEILEKYLPKFYVKQALEAKSTHENEIRILLEKVSWSILDGEISFFVLKRVTRFEA
jgi:hypothetical protein